MEKQLFFDPELCSGCRTCELVCSLYYTGECRPTRSRRRVIEAKALTFVPMACQQCKDAPCMKVCPANAISRDEKTAATVINSEKCIGCKLCMIACPFGAINEDPVDKNMVKCDLCGGEPQCVNFCPTGALCFVSPDSFSYDRKKSSAEKFAELVVPTLQGGE
jgi:carbon-monoxide dehydrogenase iron sulfur subunit